MAKTRSNRDRDVHVYNVRGASKYWMATYRGNPLDYYGHALGDSLPLGTVEEYLHSRQRDAVSAGRARAKEEKCELVIHGKDGKIKRKISYGNDPKRRKG